MARKIVVVGKVEIFLVGKMCHGIYGWSNKIVFIMDEKSFVIKLNFQET